MLGSRVRFNDRAWTVLEFGDDGVYLSNALGESIRMRAAQLVNMPGFEVTGPEGCQDGESGGLQGVPTSALEQARWWERHVLEVVTGLSPEAGRRAVPQHCYDPRVYSLAEREEAKAAELRAQGVDGASVRTVRRKRQRYQCYGLKGLIDGRVKRAEPPGARQDPRLLEALLLVMAEHPGPPRRSADFYRRETARLLEQQWFGPEAVWLPSRSTFHRLVNKIAAQSATLPGQLASTADALPPRAMPHAAPTRPGQRVLVETMHLPIGVGQDDGQTQPALMTAAFDELTHSVCAVLVHGGRSVVNGQGLLARLCSAYPADSRVPASSDARAGAAPEVVDALLPVVPEYLVVEQGLLYRSHPFLAECRRLGISVVRPSPTAKGTGEMLLRRFGELFLDQLPQTPAAGDGTAREWTLPELQSLANKAASTWQQQPTERLLRVVGPGIEPTPQAAYMTGVARTGVLQLPLSANSYPALLPSTRRAVTHLGIHVHGRTYDGYALQRLRSGRPSADPVRTQIEVRFDPFDARQVWVEERDGSWATLPLTRAPASALQPFSRRTWAAIQSRRQPGQVPHPSAVTTLASGPPPTRMTLVDTPAVHDLSLTSLEGWRRYLNTATTHDPFPADEPDWGGQQDAAGLSRPTSATGNPLPTQDNCARGAATDPQPAHAGGPALPVGVRPCS